MTVKTGSAWAGLFVTLDATGALAAGSPSGALYVDGVANAATVTITGTNPYKWSVTLPSLTAGQRVDMYITGTIATIATAGIVASEQADTSLLSDGVAVASIATDAITAAALKTDAVMEIQNGLATPTNITAGTITTVTNLTNLPAVTTDWLTAAGVKADAVTKIQNGLATAAALDAVDNFVDTEITTIDGIVDAIKLKTDLIPATPAQAGEYTAAIAAIPTTPLLAANYTAPDNATISTIAGNVDDLETRLTAARAGYLDNLNSGVALTAAGVDAILDEAVVGSYTLRQLLKVMAAAMAGKATGGGTTTVTFRGVDDTSDVIVATVDANGNRSAVTLTV